MTGPALGIMDVLIDTTSTMKNPNFLAVAHHGEPRDSEIIDMLASSFHCPSHG